MLGEVGNWTAIWWPVVSGIFVPKIVKIRESFLKLQSIMSGSLFYETQFSIGFCKQHQWNITNFTQSVLLLYLWLYSQFLIKFTAMILGSDCTQSFPQVFFCFQKSDLLCCRCPLALLLLWLYSFQYAYWSIESVIELPICYFLVSFRLTTSTIEIVLFSCVILSHLHIKIFCATMMISERWNWYYLSLVYRPL